MERRETLLQQLAERPLELVEQVLALEEQLRQKEEQLAEAQAFIAELKRQLFGPKAEKLSREEQAQIDEIVSDLREQRQRPEPLSKQVLEQERKAQRQRRSPRHPLPIKLETETVILEPEIRSCPGLRTARSHRGRSERGDGLGTGQADSSADDPSQVCRLSLRSAGHDHCASAARACFRRANWDWVWRSTSC